VSLLEATSYPWNHFGVCTFIPTLKVLGKHLHYVQLSTSSYSPGIQAGKSSPWPLSPPLAPHLPRDLVGVPLDTLALFIPISVYEIQKP
jgi:hypothetical protein